MAEDSFDPGRILAVLDQHNVEYILVGGLGARAHGAVRPTSDIDCVPEGGLVNRGRLADALSELGARLRVGGMTDDEARQLPVQLDAETLLSFGSSTWMTDAGPVDVLRELRDRDGRNVPFDVLRRRCEDQEIGGVVVHVAGLDDIIAAAPAEVSEAVDGDLDCSRGDSAPNRQITRSVIAEPYEQYPAERVGGQTAARALHNHPPRTPPPAGV